MILIRFEHLAFFFCAHLGVCRYIINTTPSNRRNVFRQKANDNWWQGPRSVSPVVATATKDVRQNRNNQSMNALFNSSSFVSLIWNQRNQKKKKKPFLLFKFIVDSIRNKCINQFEVDFLNLLLIRLEINVLISSF